MGSGGCLGDRLHNQCGGCGMVLDAKDFERKHSIYHNPKKVRWLKLINFDIKLVFKHGHKYIYANLDWLLTINTSSDISGPVEKYYNFWHHINTFTFPYKKKAFISGIQHYSTIVQVNIVQINIDRKK